MKTILIIIDIILYGTGILAAFYILYVQGDKMKSFLVDIFYDYPIRSTSRILISVILLLVGSSLLQKVFFSTSLILWLFLMFGAPNLIFKVKKIRHFNFVLSSLVALTMTYGVALFYSVDNVRDNIGYSFIPNYSVYYQTETVMVNYYDLGYIDEEKEIAYITTGNDNLNFALTYFFPTIYRGIVFFIYILAMHHFINMKNRYYSTIYE